MYIPVIGIETHVQLKTETKIFCGCANRYGNAPNTLVCPVCLGLPGTLPVLNEYAVELAVKTASALGCTISNKSVFARKNYFYPDLPKGYQISQYDEPMAKDGWLRLSGHRTEKKIRISRIHLEEDAGKMLHPEGNIEISESRIDLNRCGVPLVEIVTEPDIGSPQEAYEYLSRLRQILLYIGVSDCSMEEGSLRCDANISMKIKGSDLMGQRTELKNLNSFKFVKKALEFEINRQSELLSNGEKVIPETLAWDETLSGIVKLRSKETSEDYRYFPEPDLIQLTLKDQDIKRIRSELPELPDQKRERFISDYGIPENNAAALTSTIELAEYFEEAASHCTDNKKLSDWILSEILNILRENRVSIKEFRISPEKTAGLVELIGSGRISGRIAKDLFREMVRSGNSAEKILSDSGLELISDPVDLEKIIEDVLGSSPEEVLSYKNGNVKIIGFLIGKAMKETNGKADPVLLNKIMKEKLDNCT